MSILLFFIDGLGIGLDDATRNPLARYPSPLLSHFQNHVRGPLPHSGVFVSTDATLGVSGLPQSATGQTTLLTGVNAAQALGRHLPGFPSVTLRKILQADSIFLKLEEQGLQGTFANAFTPEYFERANRRISATTWSVKASGFPFRMLDPHLLRGEAISHDLSNHFLRKLGYEAPERTPEEAAQILARLVSQVDFCLFEYFLTDRIGHDQDMARAKTEIARLDRFLSTLLEYVALDSHTVLLTSDHGNFEDLSISTHTTDPVPTLIWGRNREELAAQIHSIQDISGAILRRLTS